MNKTQESLNKSPLTAKIFISATALLLAACQDQGPTTSSLSHEQPDLTLTQMIKGDHKTDEDKKIAAGMKAIMEGDLLLASRTFNSLLIDDPLNAQVHTLNALTYQLMAKKGEVAKTPLAKAGFEQALKIDPNNILASLQLGRIAAGQKDYVKAQEHFSNVLLQDSRNPDAQFGLAAASYQLGDLKTAQMSIDRVLTAQPNTPRTIRAAALIYAALGKNDQAQVYLSQYSTLKVLKRHKKYLERRVEDWADLHRTGRFVAQADPATAEIVDSSTETETTEADTDPESADATPTPDSPSATDQTASTPKADLGTTSTAEEAPIDPPQQYIYKDENEKMIVVDAVIMRVSETGTTKKGQNIMENFTLSLAPWNYFRARNTSGPIGSAAIFPTNNTSTETGVPGASSDFGQALKGSTATLITQGISLGTINYSLNIANSGDQYIEIIGRPTLTATVGKEAKFFSGLNKHLAVSGQFGGNITETPIGTTLKVTPISYKDGFITLDVELIGSSITEVLGSVAQAGSTATEFDVNKDNVRTTVKVKAGESIMLAGITQRNLDTKKSGFPILQHIPIIQYFFSKETSSSTRKSVMYILTPRSYERTITDTKRFFARGEEFGKRPKLYELERRHKDWYDPSINNTLILQHLGPVYDEFRTGDLHDLKWGHTDDLATQLTSIANFLWY